MLFAGVSVTAPSGRRLRSLPLGLTDGMRSLRKILLERLVASRPRRALQLACRHFGISSVQMRLPPGSPLFRSDGGESVELPLDDVITPFVLEHGRWQTEELDFIRAHL